MSRSSKNCLARTRSEKLWKRRARTCRKRSPWSWTQTVTYPSKAEGRQGHSGNSDPVRCVKTHRSHPASRAAWLQLHRQGGKHQLLDSGRNFGRRYHRRLPKPEKSARRQSTASLRRITLLPRGGYGRAVESRKPVGPPTVAREHYGRRIEFPDRFTVVAPAAGNLLRFTGCDCANPEFSRAGRSPRKSYPASVRRHGIASGVEGGRG